MRTRHDTSLPYRAPPTGAPTRSRCTIGACPRTPGPIGRPLRGRRVRLGEGPGTHFRAPRATAAAPSSPAGTVLDVGGGAAHQSLPLARLGSTSRCLDPSPAMLAKAEQRLGAEPDDVRRRVHLIEGPWREGRGGDRRSAFRRGALPRHPDVPRADRPDDARAVPPGADRRDRLGDGAERPHPGRVRPALERRWADALGAFDTEPRAGRARNGDARRHGGGPCGLLQRNGVNPEARYGVWLFTDWMDLPSRARGRRRRRRRARSQLAGPVPAAQPGVPSGRPAMSPVAHVRLI